MEAEKNKISTGTLTYEDIHNKAEYEAGSMGINIDTSKEGKRSEAGVNMIFKEAIKGYTMYKLDNKHRILVYINH